MKNYRIINGDITKATDVDFIAHQVNCQGKMGSGVAKAIREVYPVVYAEYMKEYTRTVTFALDTKCLLGKTQFVSLITPQRLEKPFYCINMFAQDKFGYDGKQYTSIDAFKKCLNAINENCKGYTVAFPWMIGCVRGGANWDEVLPLICDTLTDVKEIVFYKL